MVDMYVLQDKIVANPEYIGDILTKLGHSHIEEHGGYYSCQNLDGDNASAIVVYKDNLFYKNHTRGKSGNLFTLVSDEKRLSFADSLKWIADKLGLSVNSFKAISIKLPFNGFYKKISSNNNANHILTEYQNSLLPTADYLSKKFLDDGISLQIQEELGIRYCHEEDSILIPIYDCYNRLVGCKARNNSDEDYGRRWYAYLPYSKTSVVYGWNFNYQYITNKKLCVIFESEKSVAQCKSFDFNLGLAVAGHNISPDQAKLIKMLMTDRIILAFDEGLYEEEIIFECKKLITNTPIFKNKVGYIWDNNDVRVKGSKDSPSDLGKKSFELLMKEYVRWI